jgi:hypothetical protein
MGNLFGFTDQRIRYTLPVPDPVGPDNDVWLKSSSLKQTW